MYNLYGAVQQRLETLSTAEATLTSDLLTGETEVFVDDATNYLMKKKNRNIVVDDIEYAWSISSGNCDGDGASKVNIWKNKKLIHTVVLRQCEVTPSNIEEIIRSLC